MFTPEFKKNSSISELIKTFAPEEMVFRQGKQGVNMFIIMEGFVRIVFEKDGQKHLVGIAGPGEVLGEKAILKESKTYTRNFSAYCSTDVTLLEVTPDTLNTVLAQWPDFYSRVLKLVEDRLSKANELVAILQNPSEADRICEYILYFQKHLCAKLPKGMYATISDDVIIRAANVRREIAEDALVELVDKKILSKVADGYILVNEKALLQSLPGLREKLAA